MLHVFTEDGTLPDPAKVEAIASLQEPRNKQKNKNLAAISGNG